MGFRSRLGRIFSGGFPGGGGGGFPLPLPPLPPGLPMPPGFPGQGMGGMGGGMMSFGQPSQDLGPGMNLQSLMQMTGDSQSQPMNLTGGGLI